LFIYAHGEENFHALVGTRYAARLGSLAANFRQLFGLGDEEQLGLVLRLSHATEPTYRSMRLPLDALLTTKPTGGTDVRAPARVTAAAERVCGPHQTGPAATHYHSAQPGV
ncbi:MAG: hypothetical protein ACRDVW_08915, partial [Acidimicrobiales bacterium]